MIRVGVGEKTLVLMGLILLVLGLGVNAQAEQGVISLEVGGEATELMVSDGGLLALEGSYTTALNETSYGHTLYFKVDNASQSYDILVDGTKIGENESTYRVTENSGTLEVKTSPETTNMTIDVQDQEGFMGYVAQYLSFCKSLPSLLGNITIDLLIWAVAIIPIASVVAVKLVFKIIGSAVGG